jgi:hypothetical protein
VGAWVMKVEIIIEHEDGSRSFLHNIGNFSTVDGVTLQKTVMHGIL